EFRCDKQWPPEDVHPLIFSLAPAGRLADKAEAVSPGRSDLVYRPDVGIAAGRYAIGQMLPGWGVGGDQRLEEGLSLVDTTDPLPAQVLLGAPVTSLWLACTAEVAFVSVKLCDVAPDGTSVLVTKGVLNLTHRHSHTKPEPLVPGKVFEVRVPLQAMAYRF